MSKRNNALDKEQTANQEGGSSTSGVSKMPAYLEAALRLSTSYPLGAGKPEVISKSQGTDFVTSGVQPGVMVLNYIPTLGTSTGPLSAVNRAAFNEFNAIRSQISGNRPYEPADHMIYRAAVDSMRDLYMYMKRIYGIIRKYSATNLYRPKAILTAMGLDSVNWFENAADLYQFLKNQEHALEPFPTVPIGNISERHHVFNSYVFTDGDIDSSQTYILNQRAFWSYEKVDELKGLTPIIPGSQFGDFVNCFNKMYAALQGSSDVYIIAADIRRAFGDRVVTSLSAPNDDYVVEYVKLDPVLTSIMNATVLPDYFTSELMPAPDFGIASLRIYDDEGILKCHPNFSSADINLEVNLAPTSIQNASVGQYAAQFSHLNFIESDPDPVAILNATRFRPVITARDNGVHISSMGTEVIVGATIVAHPDIDNLEYDDSMASSVLPISSFMLSPCSEGTVNQWNMAYMLRILSALSKFDWHPPVAVPAAAYAYDNIAFDCPSSNNMYHKNDTVVVFEDTQNYVPIDDSTLQKIHDASLLAEFGF